MDSRGGAGPGSKSEVGAGKEGTHRETNSGARKSGYLHWKALWNQLRKNLGAIDRRRPNSAESRGKKDVKKAKRKIPKETAWKLLERGVDDAAVSNNLGKTGPPRQKRA